jgi:DNA-binding winged helix-turn-helix (wHTH) protein/tetratricopeptide (TPR) repeat protein
MRYVFAEYELDTRLYELRHAGQPCKLEPQVFNVLLYLIQHRDRVVTKDELLEQLWPNQFISEVMLNHRVMAARKAIGDSGRAQRCIKTVHGRGYRFIAEVRAVAPAEASLPLGPSRAAAPVPSPLAEPGAPVGGQQPPPFVAREAEVQHLHQYLAAALRGERQVVFITGEAGIGKTALVDTFVAQVAPTAPVWLGWGQCLEQHGAGEPYLPLLEVLGRWGRGPDGGQLVAVLRQQAPSWLLQLPALVPEDDYVAMQRRGGGMTRERMLRELAEAVEALTATRPVVLVLEDLHWSDAATIDWLAYVGRRREVARLLVLGTYRPTEARVQRHPVHTVAQELQRYGLGRELGLGYFSEAAVAAYLEQRLGTAPLPVGLVRALHQRTTGNPLFLTAVVDMLVRQGQLREGGTGGEGGEALAVHLGGVPESLRQLIEQQLTQLAPDVQVLLEAASVAGQEYAVAAVAAAVGQAVEVVEEHCATLARQGQFLRAVGPEVWPDGPVAERYGFVHDLYRETLYARVPEGRRVRWHRQIGCRLEAGYGPQAREVAAELAEHFVRGRDTERAMQYLWYAAQNTLRRSAHREAVRYYERALQMLQHLPQQPDTQAQSIDLHLELRNALVPLGEMARILQHLREAEALAQGLGDVRRQGRIVTYLTRDLQMLGQHAEAVTTGLRALTMVQDDIALRVTTHLYLSYAYHGLGEYRRATEVLRHEVATLSGALSQEYFGLAALPAVSARVSMVYNLAELGEFAEGVVLGSEALQIAEAAGQPFSLTQAYRGLGILYLQQGRFAHALPLLEQGLALCRYADLPLAFPAVASYLGMAYAQAGRLAEAQQQGAAIRLGDRQTLRMLLLGTGYLHAGRLQDALPLAQEALAIARERQERGVEGYALHLLGALAASGTSPDVTLAATYYQQALTLAKELSMRPLMAHCHLGLGQVYAQMAQREQTYAELSAAMMLYQAMHMSFWYSQVEAARAQVPGP